MLLLAYSIFDAKAQFYRSPFFLRSRGEALRGWETAANDPKGDISKYSTDYCLYEIGTFNEDSGELTKKPFESLGYASEYVKT